MEKSSLDYTAQPIESWKIPFGVILAIHIGLAAAITFTPSFSKKAPRFENIYTIDLIDLPPTAAPAQAAPPLPTPTPAPTPQKLEPVKNAVPIVQEVPKEPAPVENAQPISISPKKKKIKHKTKPEPSLKKEDRSEMVEKRKRLAELIRKEAEAEQAEKEARQALQELEEERQFAANTMIRPHQPTTSSTTSGGGSSLTGVEARWFSAVKSHVLGYWALPDLKLWSPDLVTTMIVTVNRSGQIVDSYVETPSGDRVFDQFVKKSIQDANPLPAMPAAMKQRKFEIGLHFRPDTIN